LQLVIDINTPLSEITCHMGSHPAAANFGDFTQPKLVLDLVTLKGFRLSWPGWWLYPKVVYLQNSVSYLRN